MSVRIKYFSNIHINQFVLMLCCVGANFFSYSQVAVVTESFSASTPSVGTTAWTTDAASWNLTGATSPRSGSNDATIGSGVANNKYFYIPITIKQNFVYSINFWTKNIIGIKIVVNETADLVTPIYTYTLADASAGGSTSWKNVICDDFLASAVTTSGFVMVCLTSATNGGSTGAIDDFSITEQDNSTRVNNFYINDGTYNASDVYSTAVGNDGNTGKSKALPKRTLTSMINTYSGKFITGDSIFIDAGTFSTETYPLSCPRAGVVIHGAGASKTIFSIGSSSDVYFMSIDVNNTTLSNFKITGFDATTAASTGKAIDVYGVTGVKINNVQVDANGNTAGGYPIEVRPNGSAYPEVTFNGGGATCNKGWTNAGGMRVTGSSSTVTINYYSFIDNQRSGQQGAALRVENGIVTVNHSLYKLNTTYNSVSGSAVYLLAGTLKIYDSSFNGNKYDATTNSYGGTIKIDGGNFRITRSTLTSNINSNTSVAYGAGIGIAGGTAIVDSCFFSGNTGSQGNDIHVKGGSLLATNNTFSSSSAQIGIAGGTFSISTSGAPGEYVGSGSIYKFNTTVSTYTPSPTVPTFSGTCATTVTLVVLPIELTRFEGDCNNGDVMLTWQTASEKNNHIFNVERSADGVQFEIIGSLKGAGTYEGYNNYTFIDNNKFDGLAYYRLSQQDYNGKVSQSKIISVEHLCGEHNDAEIFIYPNPSQNNAVINLKLLKKSSVSTLVYDGIGRLVASLPSQNFEVGLQNINIDANDFAPGIYFIKTSINDKEYVQKFVKL